MRVGKPTLISTPGEIFLSCSKRNLGARKIINTIKYQAKKAKS
jgi:hypothetical protein